jgi:DNA-binding CsgD family transcriptional regulator
MTPQMRAVNDSRRHLASHYSIRRPCKHTFVSELRATISQLLDDGLSANEIAHRLDVARSTVGYHLLVLRGGADKRVSPSQKETTGPAAPPLVTRDKVRRLLDAGNSRVAVARLLGLSRSTVSYHARQLGADIDARCARRYDWQQIGRYHDEGHSPAECRATFGFSKPAWHQAVRRGLIAPRPARMPLEQLLARGQRRNRNHLKQRLFDAGLKSRACESCGLSEWRGQSIPLALHHVNGDRHDNRLENLQILCSNCHGQTDNWAGKNLPSRLHRPVARDGRRDGGIGGDVKSTRAPAPRRARNTT